MRKITVSIIIVLIVLPIFSATRKDALKRLHPVWKEADKMVRRKAFEDRMNLLKTSLFKALSFKNVGPMAQGGRVIDLVMDERKPTTWMVAYATGGVWLTNDDGNTWKPIFEKQPAFSIGAIAVSWGKPGIPKTIWVGTGEASNTRTVYMGAGLFRSNDQGKTWKRVALENSQHIARIAINPKNPDIVFVAALGPVYTDGGERGLYKTTDNGKTWKKVINPPKFTGAVEVIIDKVNPNIVYAATWERRRKAWDFRESGKGSAIWKSTDGGETFIRLSGGLPNGDGMGRIALAQSYQNPNKIYAFIDNQTPRPNDKDNPKPLLANEFLKMKESEFLKLSDIKIDQFLRLYRYPRKMTAKSIRKAKKENKFKFEDMKIYIKGIKNIKYYWPKCIGPELYITEDAGKTWKKTHKADLRGQVDWGYGTATYYFGKIAVDPSNDKRVFICAISLLKTEDGGKTFDYADKYGYDVHSDHHAIFFDSRDSNRVIIGNDGGLNISLNGGKTWRPIKNLPVAQCYTVTYDMAKPYRIYSGLQDNGISMGYAREIKPYQQVDSWKSIWGADGMFVQVNPKDNNTVILDTQFGPISRLDLKTGKSKSITPQPNYPYQEAFRTNWVTPIVMSKFHPDIIYTGTQFVLRSFDRGDTWKTISPDLTSEGKKGSFVNVGGNVSYGTITAIAESPKRFGLVYAGTDEGWVWVTKDAGKTWERCKKGIPNNKWVTRIEASSFDEATVFATFTGFREDDTRAYVYKSTDYGKTWKSIKGNLPNECMNVIRQDPVNKDILYVGSDFGVYVSLDGGKHWDALGVNMPNVPAYDLCVHPREKDLIIGTYGRSVWVGSVKVLEAYTPDVRKKQLYIFKIDKQTTKWWWEKEKPVQVGEPRKIEPLEIFFHSKTPGKVIIRIEDKKAKVYRKWDVFANKGINKTEWNFLVNKSIRGKLPKGRRPFVRPGKYVLIMEKDGAIAKTDLIIEEFKKVNHWF